MSTTLLVSEKIKFVAEKNYFLGAALVIFLLTKLTHIHLPFFWDESWVYAPAIKIMAEQGPSLLPDSIPVEYSRGHPLFFHFLGGLWIKIFGDQNQSLHLFALSLSLFAILSFNCLFRNISSTWIANLTTVLILSQPIIYAQSSLVLPEMLLAGLSALTLNYYISRRFWLYVLLGTLTILTKETGVMIILSITIFHVFESIQLKCYSRDNIRVLVILFLPLLALIWHVLYLKNHFGWFLFPEHTQLIRFSFRAFAYNLLGIMEDLSSNQGRVIFSLISFSILLFSLFKNFKNHFLFISIFILLSIMIMFVKGINSIIPFIGLILLVFLFFKESSAAQSKRNLPLLIIYLVFFLAFSSINFFTSRYLISVLPIFLFIFISSSIKSSFNTYFINFFIFFIGIGIVRTASPSGIKDANLSYLYFCPAQKEVVEYMEKNNLYDQQIQTNFLMENALKNEYSGYRNTEKEFLNLNIQNINLDKDSYYIFYNAEPDFRRSQIISMENAQLLKRISNKLAWFEIWQLSTN